MIFLPQKKKYLFYKELLKDDTFMKFETSSFANICIDRGTFPTF